MKILKTSNMSTPSAILVGALIFGVSIFLTTWIFFGGNGNRQKLFLKSPTTDRVAPPNPMTSEQIKKIQEQRAAQMNSRAVPTQATTTN